MTNLLAEIYQSQRFEIIDRFETNLGEQDPWVGSHVVLENVGVTPYSDIIITFNPIGEVLAVTDRIMTGNLTNAQCKNAKKEHKRLHKNITKELTEDFVLFYSEDKDLVEMVYCRKEWYDCIVFIAYQEHAF